VGERKKGESRVRPGGREGFIAGRGRRRASPRGDHRAARQQLDFAGEMKILQKTFCWAELGCLGLCWVAQREEGREESWVVGLEQRRGGFLLSSLFLTFFQTLLLFEIGLKLQTF
jgi:hypothetical protein